MERTQPGITISDGSRVRVLVVDDQPVILRVVSIILKSEYYVVTTASDGKAALDLCLFRSAPV